MQHTFQISATADSRTVKVSGERREFVSQATADAGFRLPLNPGSEGLGSVAADVVCNTAELGMAAPLLLLVVQSLLAGSEGLEPAGGTMRISSTDTFGVPVPSISFESPDLAPNLALTPTP